MWLTYHVLVFPRTGIVPRCPDGTFSPHVDWGEQGERTGWREGEREGDRDREREKEIEIHSQNKCSTVRKGWR